MTYEAAPNAKGDREYYLRKRFRSEWESLSNEDRFHWFKEACLRLAKQPTADHGEFVRGLIDTYAWTLFAESMDPKEAKAIANAGWHTPETMAATARVEDIF